MEKLRDVDQAVTNDQVIHEVADLIAEEYRRAAQLFEPFHSPHEGWAVLKEQLDDLWEQVTKKAAMLDPERLTNEAVQVGAMAMRFVIDICMAKSPGLSASRPPGVGR